VIGDWWGEAPERPHVFSREIRTYQLASWIAQKRAEPWPSIAPRLGALYGLAVCFLG
jgi:hypothetical protein